MAKIGIQDGNGSGAAARDDQAGAAVAVGGANVVGQRVGQRVRSQGAGKPQRGQSRRERVTENVKRRPVSLDLGDETGTANRLRTWARIPPAGEGRFPPARRVASG